MMQTFRDSTFAEHAANGMALRTSADRIPQPEIAAKHVDGPVLYFSDGQLHWLTFLERIQYRYGLTDAHKLQRKLRPRLTAEMEYFWANRGSK